MIPGLLTGCGDDAAEVLGSPSYAATILDGQAAIRQALIDTNTPSISVALVDDQRVIWAEAFGVIDKEQGVAPSTETRFCIGSCSKVLAAMATMILVERGLVDLDAPLVTYVPDFAMLSPAADTITIRQLLSHASGLPGTNFVNIFAQAPQPDYAERTQIELADQRLKHDSGRNGRLLQRWFHPDRRPGGRGHGSKLCPIRDHRNPGPGGDDPSAYPRKPFPAGTFAPAFAEDSDTPLPQEFTNGFATGGLYATPSDMGRLARLLLQGGILEGRRILSAASVAEMARDQTQSLDFNPIPSFQWGLGWDDVAQKGLAAVGVKAWTKNGGTLFYGSQFFVLPEARLGLAMSGTTLTYGSGKLAERILLNALVESGRLAAMPVPLPATPAPEAAVDDATLAAMAGYFAHHEAVLRVEVQPDRALTLSTFDSGTWTETARDLKYRADATFASDSKPLYAYRPLTAEFGDYQVVRIPWGYEHCLLELPYAQRVPPRGARAPDWERRLGREWLLVNDGAASWTLRMGLPRLRLDGIPELPGYVGVTTMSTQLLDASQDGQRARMWMMIPLNNGRDLADLVIVNRAGEEWVRFGSCLYRPLEGVPVLEVGGITLTVEVASEALWLQVPARGTLTLRNAASWLLYDGNFVLAGGRAGGGHPSAAR